MKTLITIIFGVIILGWFAGCANESESHCDYRGRYSNEPQYFYTYEDYPIVKYHIYKEYSSEKF